MQADLRKRALTREKVTALVVNLLEETMIRIGNEAYARQNETYGLTTLQDDHVEVSASKVAFEFRGKSGKEHEIVVNEYLRTATSCDFTAKDFRTWGGTITAAHLLNVIGPATTEKDAERNVVQVIKGVATKLGNTPAVCRQHYVHPTIVTAYQEGHLAPLYADIAAQEQSTADLAADEAVVYALLSQQDDER